MKSLILPELNFELERVVCQRVIDGEHAKNGSDYSSLITLPEIGVVGDAYHSPLATIEWWQTCRNSGLFQNGTSSPITQSVLCEAVWETQVVHVNHISPNGPSAVGTESSGCCDSQRDDHPPFTFTSDPTVINGLQGDTPCRVGVQPLWFQSQEQARYDSGGGNSWSFEGWHSDVKAISLTGDGSSPYPPSDPDNISSHFEYIDSYRQEVPTHPTTAPENLCLPNTTGFVKYSSSPISAGWASYSVDEDHQRCGNNDAGTSELRRHAKDDFLVRSKRSGMSYREIRNKGHFKEAESTLRGRYRTLTKRREQRVRKPQWQPKDIQLLHRAVAEASAKCNTVRVRQISPGFDNTDMMVKSSKISWKQVAEYISLHDGTYHFGNATCRKKWDEINSGSPSRKAPFEA